MSQRTPRILNGRELAGFIKERQARQVRALRQSRSIYPRLAIVQTRPDPVIDKYVALKARYGEDILVSVDHHMVEQADAMAVIERLNADRDTHAIIVQLPLHDESQTAAIVNAVAPGKDVDGLGEHAAWDPATAVAINWLVSGYNIDLNGKRIVIIGQGRLVGAPLTAMWRASGFDVTPLDLATPEDERQAVIRRSDIIVTATGSPHSLLSDIVPIGAVVIDAGTAAESGSIVGDVADDVYDRSDLTMTPPTGGVGPLTVAALFDNVIRSAAHDQAS